MCQSWSSVHQGYAHWTLWDPPWQVHSWPVTSTTSKDERTDFLVALWLAVEDSGFGYHLTASLTLGSMRSSDFAGPAKWFERLGNAFVVVSMRAVSQQNM